MLKQLVSNIPFDMFNKEKRLVDLIAFLKAAFFQPGNCFIWRQADTPELAGKWDVMYGLRDGVEKAWLEKDEEYVQDSVAAEVQKVEMANAYKAAQRRKRKASEGSWSLTDRPKLSKGAPKPPCARSL